MSGAALLTLSAALAVPLAAAPALAGDLTVTVAGLKPKGGVVMIGLWDERTFGRTQPLLTATADAGGRGEVTVVFTDVKPGDYAVNAFHDADRNGRPTLTDGRLAEGTALSNATTLREPPSFASSRFAVPASGTTVTIRMSYPEDRAAR